MSKFSPIIGISALVGLLLTAQAARAGFYAEFKQMHEMGKELRNARKEQFRGDLLEKRQRLLQKFRDKRNLWREEFALHKIKLKEMSERDQQKHFFNVFDGETEEFTQASLFDDLASFLKK